jgi:mono/diheme cytochrome c family protein
MLVICVSVLGSVTFARAAEAITNAAFQPKLPDFSRYMQGRFVYERNCVVCHGATGKGDGEMSRELIPKPRSFRSGLFKYRSTPPGALPTTEDLLRTVRHGVPNTSMPIFDKLSRGDLEAVVEYVKFFSKRWDDPKNYAPPLNLPATPAWLGETASRADAATRGRESFLTACASCHAVDGRGNGPAAATLVDAWEQPIRPTNLREGTARVGGAPEDLYRLLVTGLEGTPMPAFTDALTETQRWELVAYLLELRVGSEVSGASANSAQPDSVGKFGQQ